MKTNCVYKTSPLFVLYLALTFICSCNEKPPPPPDTTEIAGTWQTHSLVVNQAGGWSWQGWIHATLNIDNIGNADFSNVVTSAGGNSANNSNEIEISTDHVITIKGASSYNAYLSADKQLTIATMTDGSGGYNLSLAHKINPAVTYATSDLQGTWQMHLLADGKQENLTSWSGWTHALLTIGSAGNGEFTDVTSSPGGNTVDDSVFVSIALDGFITDSANSTYHGFMSADKQMMVATMTTDDEGFTLAIGQKISSGTTYTQADLEGTWKLHSVVAGNNNFTQWAGWIHGDLTIDDMGNGTFSDMVESSGNSISNSTATISISSAGIVSVAGDLTFHGYLSSDKSTLIATITDSRGGYNISILQKKH